MSTKISLALYTLLFWSGMSLAIEPEQRDAGAMQKVIRAYLDSGHYRVFGMDLLSADIPDIIKSIGDTKPIKGPHGTEVICYEDELARRFIYEKMVNGFGYSVGADTADDAQWNLVLNLDCALSANIAMDGANGFGLRLGLVREQVFQLLGKPSVDDEGGALEFHYLTHESTESKKGRVNYEVYSILTVLFVAGRVSYYSVYTTLSN